MYFNLKKVKKKDSQEEIKTNKIKKKLEYL